MGFLPPSPDQIVAAIVRQLDHRWGVSVRAGLATVQSLIVDVANSLDRIADSHEAGVTATRHLAASQWGLVSIAATAQDLSPSDLAEYLLAIGYTPEDVAAIGFDTKVEQA